MHTILLFKLKTALFLNQARAGLRPGFLTLILCKRLYACVCVCVCVCMFVCVSAPEAINN